MGFEFLDIDDNKYIKDLPEYKAAVDLNGGYALPYCCLDKVRGFIFFVLSVEYSQERPPGDYVLFCNGMPIKMAAYKTDKWVDGIGKVATYLVDELDYDKDAFPDQLIVVNTLKEALLTRELNYSVKSFAVDIEFL